MITLTLVSIQQSFATTIVPFNNLGELAINSDLVVSVKATEIRMDIQDRIEREVQTFEVREVILGDYSEETLEIVYLSESIGKFIKQISYDYKFIEGNSYLLFLNYHNGAYVPVCMSYYIYEEVEYSGATYLRPNEAVAPQVLKQTPYERPQVISLEKLISQLKMKTDKAWDESFYQVSEELQSRIAKPINTKTSHCNPFLFNVGGNMIRSRWQNNENSTLPVHYQNINTSGCSDINSQMSDAINHMSSEYQGLNIELGAPFSGYTSDCNSTPPFPNLGDPVDVEFQDYINNNFVDGQRILIQFDDPCNTIPDLVNCSGTLAYGGSYVFVNPFTYNNMEWLPSVYGFVVFNESAGTCLCGNPTNVPNLSEYSTVIVHELTHALGFNHIDANSGAANMNPSCCSEITSLDIECIDVAYAPIAPSCSDGIQNQGELAVDCGGPCTACVTGCDTDNQAYNYVTNPDIAEACETCFDGIQNGDEEGLDCNGTYPSCPVCPCLEVFASNYNQPGPCFYDCNETTNVIISGDPDTLITSSNVLSTIGTINLDAPSSSSYWRAETMVQVNANTTIESELTIDVGPCDD